MSFINFQVVVSAKTQKELNTLTAKQGAKSLTPAEKQRLEFLHGVLASLTTTAEYSKKTR